MVRSYIELQILHFNNVINNQEQTIKDLLDLINKQKLYIEKLSKYIPKNNIIYEDDIELVPE